MKTHRFLTILTATLLIGASSVPSRAADGTEDTAAQIAVSSPQTPLDAENNPAKHSAESPFEPRKTKCNAKPVRQLAMRNAESL